MKAFKQKDLSFWNFQIAGWILYEVVSISRYFFYHAFLGKGIVDTDQTIRVFTVFLTCDSFAFLLTLAMRYIYRSTFVKNFSLRATIGAILLTSLVMTAISHTFDFFFEQVVAINYESTVISFYKAIYSSSINIIIFIAWSGLYFGVKYWKQWSIERERADKADYLAQSAQLQMLRYQLNPHFLFNSLNSVIALVDEDKNASKEMLRELSDFLRYSLVNRNLSMIPLREELDAIKLYLSIEKKRFEDKLEITFDIDPEATEYPVLSFIIHPLIENAVKYGMRTSSLPLHLFVSALVTDNNLTITVANSGKWIDPALPDNDLKSTGLGLQNVKQRLESTFPKGSYFKIEQVNDQVVATIYINSHKS